LEVVFKWRLGNFWTERVSEKKRIERMSKGARFRACGGGHRKSSFGATPPSAVNLGTEASGSEKGKHGGGGGR